ncbi:long-chain-acyl-CoA synthetase [Parvibaculum sp.]|jgi:fatty-acyl-CoA synthase|uniref:long-chain-acyl-CoA synthetase n=1 Tax=Parvibaculum sp. TaxID=2024848 RepID=UPI000C691D72|nr:long-chain-acyl-CoA synthetase [Parvibaculum sp.]MAM93140.1 long-chain-acyl-CoA synthetase [Parvibaculum sp.]|tara:strand:+ start:37602 stop:39404 length:1803 start_codon:yes stop_codon:yes gene_type:complete
MGLVKRIGNEIIFVRAVLRSLKRLKEIGRDTTHTFSDTIEALAEEKPDNIAIYFEDRKLTYREYNAEANRYARWAKGQGLGRGSVVALMMENRPEYLIAWLGIIKAGATAALINTNLIKGPLAHSLNISTANHVVLGAELAEHYFSAADQLERPMTVWATGGAIRDAQDLDAALAQQSSERLPADLRKDVTQDDDALFIYTSGTTGNPKAARIPHVRLRSMMGAFSAGANATEKDRMYVVLPLYHSAGGVCAVGTTLTVGGSVILQRKFSATHFWDDIVKYKATLFQYIGELCRYLLNTEKHPKERKHKIRLAVGNGLRPEIWTAFQKRFRIPRILEFYGATEGNVGLMNFDGTPGAIGRIPGWAKAKFNVEIVKFDIENEQPLRGPDGFCMRAAPGEAGEAIGKIIDDPKRPTGRFDGYAKKEETEKKILRDVFEKGDVWFRTGDLLRQDKLGYFYFVDRIGDTFRWKGENVATSEVAEAISVFPGVKEANVYGVHVPGADGRAGMASIVAENGKLDLEKFRAQMLKELPEYAVPVFLRIQPEIEVTGTFKHRKVELVKEGFDPSVISEPIFFNCPVQKKYVPVDQHLYGRICAGEIRL